MNFSHFTLLILTEPFSASSLSFFIFAPLNYNHLVSFFKFIDACSEKKKKNEHSLIYNHVSKEEKHSILMTIYVNTMNNNVTETLFLKSIFILNFE
jgi:hypothetical protein